MNISSIRPTWYKYRAFAAQSLSQLRCQLPLHRAFAQKPLPPTIQRTAKHQFAKQPAFLIPNS